MVKTQQGLCQITLYREWFIVAEVHGTNMEKTSLSQVILIDIGFFSC